MTARFAADDGLRLAFLDEGAGVPAVICLAGLTRNMADFDALAAHLAPRNRVVRLDSRGRGDSDRDPDWQNYNAAREARDALALMDHLGIARAVAVGTSRGGLLAMMIAATAPGRLAGVVLNDVGPVLEPEGLARIRGYLGVTPDFPDLDAAARAIAADEAARFPGVPLAAWRDHAARMFRAGPDGLELNYDAHLRDAFLAQTEGPPPDLWPLFEALAGVPTLLLHGANSDLLSDAGVAAMRARRPDIDVVEVADRGHVPFLDEPEALAAVDRLLARAAA